MVPRRLPRLTVLATVVAFLASACDSRDVQNVGASTPFVFMLSPAHGADAQERAELAAYLSEHTGMSVDVEVAPSADAAVTSVGAAQADAWLLPLFSYLFCVQEYGVEAGLQVVRAGDSHEYVGEIVVRGDSDIQDVAQLAGKRIAYVDPHSTSGFLLPAALLREAGVEAEPVFAGSHEAALELLRDGDVDAAAVYRGASEGDPALRAIAHTRSVPNEPIFFRSGLAPELRQRFTHALEAYAQTDEGHQVLGAMADITGFAPITNAAYGEVRTVLQAADHDLEDLVPRGWLIHNQNQLSPVDYAH